jgi:cell division protein ZapA (FtsZ GTPase activity inhibitor)
MPIVNINVRNQVYQIHCEEGEQAQLTELSEILNSKLNKFANDFGSANEKTLFIMSMLTMLDENRELNKLVEQMKNKLKVNSLEKVSMLVEHFDSKDVDIAVSQAIDVISEYLETLAKKQEIV